MKNQVLFPKIEAREKGFLEVSDSHTYCKCLKVMFIKFVYLFKIYAD